jgi:hypothetical protein
MEPTWHALASELKSQGIKVAKVRALVGVSDGSYAHSDYGHMLQQPSYRTVTGFRTVTGSAVHLQVLMEEEATLLSSTSQHSDRQCFAPERKPPVSKQQWPRL